MPGHILREGGKRLDPCLPYNHPFIVLVGEGVDEHLPRGIRLQGGGDVRVDIPLRVPGRGDPPLYEGPAIEPQAPNDVLFPT